MTSDRLDLLALRIAVARDQGRVRANVGLEVRVVAAQLAELALAGALIDDAGRPAVVDQVVVDGTLAPVRARVEQLAGWRWEQLFWLKGIDAKAVLARAVAELVDAGSWVRTARGRPFRPARYADVGGAELQNCVARIDEVLAGREQPSARESILVAVLALRFLKNAAGKWMDEDWVTDDHLAQLAPSERVTVQCIAEAADQIAALMLGGGTGINANTMGGA